MTTDALSTARQVGWDAARSVREAPKRVRYVEAQGFLCHELLVLLGGRVEYVLPRRTTLRQWLAARLAPTFPSCRWHPPDGAVLEEVAQPDADTTVYRCKSDTDGPVVFFVQYQPEPPAGQPGDRFPYNVPRLDMDHFLRAPFTGRSQQLAMARLRGGCHLGPVFEPIPMSDDARDYADAIHRETCRGL